MTELLAMMPAPPHSRCLSRYTLSINMSIPSTQLRSLKVALSEVHCKL